MSRSTRPTVAQKVTERRNAAGLSIQEVARLAGVSRQTLYDLEAGKTVPQISTLRKIARALDTSHTYLASTADAA